jgi:hypothetical protein
MKKWNKSTDGASLPTYSLSKEYDSIWFATVFPRDGKYIFTIGQRITKDEPTSICTWQNVGWKNPNSAKAKAIEWINLMKMMYWS